VVVGLGVVERGGGRVRGGRMVGGEEGAFTGGEGVVRHLFGGCDVGSKVNGSGVTII
jgi:hypothetical protein